MKNYVQRGRVITAIAPLGGVVSGQGVKIGALFGVAATSAAQGEAFELQTEDVFDLPKAGSQAWAVGDAIYWDAVNDECTSAAAGNYDIGVAVSAVGSGANETTGRVRLNGRARAQGGGGEAATVDIALSPSGVTDGMLATLTVKDGTGATVAAVHSLEFWFSDAATGAGLTADSFSGALTATKGVINSVLTAKKHVLLHTAADGIAIMQIVDSANPVDVYAVVANPRGGGAIVSEASGTNWEGV